MRRVEVVEPNGFKEGYLTREFGDIFTSQMGDEYVRLGWCKCVETGEIGERIEGTQKLKASSVVKKFK